MTILWLFAGDENAPHEACEASNGQGFVDLVATLLAYLDYDDVRQLSCVCRAAARSHVRAHMLERTIVQLSSSSIAVHAVLRQMKLRSHLHTFEIRDCLTPPHGIHDLGELLSNTRHIKFSDEPKLDRDVLDEAERMHHESGSVRKMNHAAHVRMVRRRLNEEHRTVHPRETCTKSRHVIEVIELWLAAMNSSVLEHVDFGAMQIEDLRWIQRFFLLKTLHFNGSTKSPVDNLLEPLALATSLEELTVTKLGVRTCDQLGALRSLKKLEIRSAPRLQSIAFVKNLVQLQNLVLSEINVSDLSPLLHLNALSDLTIDTIGASSFVSCAEDASVPTPAFPILRRLQIVFTRTNIDRLLQHCPRINQLHFCEVRLRSWQPLRTLDFLEQVSVSIDGIEDWTPLGNLRRLKRLALDSRRGLIASEHFVTRWEALEELISPPWDDFSALVEGAPVLRLLHLLGWRSRDSSTLGVLKNVLSLRTLRIAFVPGTVELSTVGELHQLQCLDLWNASVVTIEFLRGMKNLTELKLACPFRVGVDIINFAPLEQLQALESLVLSGRREFKNDNLEVLTRLPRLKNLDVSDSGISPSSMRKLRSQYNLPISKLAKRVHGRLRNVAA